MSMEQIPEPTPEARAKLAALRRSLMDIGSVLVAFSGGVDSSFLLKVAHDTLNTPDAANPKAALGITARSSTYPKRELEEAIRIAGLIGAPHSIIDSEEMEIEGYSDNPPDRCYFCKGELFGKLVQIAEEGGYAAVLDGANADDLADYRPGSRAAREKNVRSLLQEVGMTKEEIRQLSREMDLPTWDKPSFACLASRFPFGEKITLPKLSRIDQAENFLRGLGFVQLRVRNHGDIARIELAPEDITKAAAPDTAKAIHQALLGLGFKFVTLDLAGYHTGSMNATLPPEGENAL